MINQFLLKRKEKVAENKHFLQIRKRKRYKATWKYCITGTSGLLKVHIHHQNTPSFPLTQNDFLPLSELLFLHNGQHGQIFTPKYFWRSGVAIRVVYRGKESGAGGGSAFILRVYYLALRIEYHWNNEDFLHFRNGFSKRMHFDVSYLEKYYGLGYNAPFFRWRALNGFTGVLMSIYHVKNASTWGKFWFPLNFKLLLGNLQILFTNGRVS